MMPEQTTTPISYPALVLDASAGSVFVGILASDTEWIRSCTTTANALEGLFESVAACLESANLQLDSIPSYIYCEGPGSVLGLRLCAMAIETWRKVSPISPQLYRYNSLALTAALLRADRPEIDKALLVADWKKAVWHSLNIGGSNVSEVRPISDGELIEIKCPLFHLPQRKGWQAAPSDATMLHYEPVRLIEVISEPNLLSSSTEIELFTAGANTFQKWAPERHPFVR